MAGASRDGSANGSAGRRPGWARALYGLTPWRLRAALGAQAASIAEIQGLLEAANQGLGAVDRRLDGVENAIRMLQDELERLRDERLVAVDHRFDGLEVTLAELRDVAIRTRDELVPAVVDRGNLLVDRLARELDEVASLVERMLRSEPLPVPVESAVERELAAALRTVQPLLIEALRGGEEEIRHRLDAYLPLLEGSSPVLDLGCGRGELLTLLREAGIDAAGVEDDSALVQAARRRGLAVDEGDALESLRSRPAASAGAITAVHLLEHLHPAVVLRLLAEIRRVLRPGGLLLAECPNPHTLRVGAADYWVDPTHVRPLPSRLLTLFATASGLEVERVEYLRPYPDEQRLAVSAALGRSPAAPTVTEPPDRLDRLVERLDELLNGPRDYLLVARRPAEV